MAYTGYLWDFLRNRDPISEEEVWKRVEPVEQVYIMWDINSSDRIQIPNYWRFPKDAVIQSSPSILRMGAAFLPEDFYMFDDSCDWAGVLTHEWIDSSRYCLWST
jgi:hypothetical protein